ncbi:MAG: FAD:protein FMN transferase, partial [bacterium]|nr:FAD:protein FMN transferase [bacterium]
VPDEEQIKEAIGKTGYKKLSVRLSPPAVRKQDPVIYCDFSAVAKGFGVDKVAGYLDVKGYTDYLVEIGGEVRARGVNHKGQSWRIGIETPDGTRSLQKILPLKDVSLATSGDYHNYFEKDGVRYSHTIDPTTGKPVTHKLASVSVIHRSCMVADAMATAIDVMGPEKGYRLAVKENLPVFMIVRQNNTFVEKKTPRFREMFEK